MSFFGLFGNKPTPKSIANQVSRAKEQYAQQDYRRMAMDQLLDWNTPESIEGVLERFSSVVQSPHWDEEEKRWLVGELVTKGDIAKEALVRFIKKSNEVSHAAEALSKLASSQEEFLQILISALVTRKPEDYKSAQAKMELIALIGNITGDDSVASVVPYLNDHNDDVKCKTIDVLKTKSVASAHELFVKILSEDNHSARVLRHAAAAVKELGLTVDESTHLSSAVAEDYVVKNGKLVQRHN